MAGEKQRAADQITSRIKSYAKEVIQKEHDDQITAIQNELKQYRKDLQKHFDERLKLEEQQFNQSITQKQALQRYEVQQNLLRFRQSLLEAFKQRLITELQDFRKHPGYHDYLKQVIQDTVGDGAAIILLDHDDAGFINDARVQYQSLPLGGIKIEQDQMIYDYSFTTRLEEALEGFQKNPQLRIEGGSNEYNTRD